MKDETGAITDMYMDTGIRTDLFSIKQVTELTGMSRSNIIKLEEKGFLHPHSVNKKTGYRYYDTFNIFKLLQYKRLRATGLSQNEIFNYYEAGNQGLTDTLDALVKQKKIIDNIIELISLRTNTENNYSFSFYDFDEMMCLKTQVKTTNLEHTNMVAYNLSVDALSRGLKPLYTEEIYCELVEKINDNERVIKIYQPIDSDIPDTADKSDIELIAPCRTYSMLVYGLNDVSELLSPYKKLLEKINELGLTPTGAPVRIQAIVARYVAMHMEESEHVFRLALPIE